MKTRNVLWALVADVIGIIVFVAIGRRNHDEGVAPTGVIETAAPFLIALLIGWLIARAWNEPLTTRTGTIIWVTTVVVGMVLRRFAFDRGTATPFVIVASVATLVLLVGWRVVAQWIVGRRTERRTAAEK